MSAGIPNFLAALGGGRRGGGGTTDAFFGGLQQARAAQQLRLQQEQAERNKQAQAFDFALRLAPLVGNAKDAAAAVTALTGSEVPTAGLPVLEALVKAEKQKQKAAEQQGQAAFATSSESGFSARAKGLGNELEGPSALTATLQALRDQEALAGGPGNPLAQGALRALTSRAAGETGTIAGETRRDIASEGRLEARNRRAEARADARARRRMALGNTEFERLNRQLETGQFADGTAMTPDQLKRARLRMEKLQAGGGQFIQLPDGTVIASGSAGIAEATKSRAANLIDDRMQIGETISMVNEAIGLATEEPTRAGISGSLVSGVQTAVGVTQDLSSLFAGQKGEYLNELSSMIQTDVLEQRADQGVINRLEDIQGQEAVMVLGEVLAYEVAKVLRGQGRLTVNDWENAHRIVNLRGVKSSEQAVERLRQVEKWLQKKAANTERKMKAQGVPVINPMEDDLSPAARRVLERLTQ